MKRIVLSLLGYYGNHATHVRASRELYARCLLQAAQPQMIDVFRPPKLEFAQLWEMNVVHVWLLLRRLQRVGSANGDEISKEKAKRVAQNVFERMWEDSENQVQKAGVSQFHVSRYTKQLQLGFYGVSIPYELGFSVNAGASGDAVLAGAMFRNMHQFDNKTLSAVALRNSVAYMRAQSLHLAQMTDEEVLRGDISWLPWEVIEESIK
jgi:hypothetical protein